MGRHEHVTVKDAHGRDICRFCSQVVTKPILSSDDPRLVGAGTHRSGGQSSTDIEWDGQFPPLPEMLIALYFNAKFLGLPQAPRAQYVEIVAQEEGHRFESKTSIVKNDPDALWEVLCKKWSDQCLLMINKKLNDSL